MRDRGHAAVELGLAAALLIFPVALAVLSFGPWSETRVVAGAAAAEAARAAVISLDTDSGISVVSEIARNHGLEGDGVMIGWCGASPALLESPAGWCAMERGTEVSVEVRMWTPLVATPWGQVGGVWVSATHSEPVDLYRSLG